MKLFVAAAVLTFALVSATTQFPDAPTGFDNKSNGMVDDATHQADQTKFEEVEQLSDGLGPLYNAQSCRECHQSPVSGAASQVTELRVGHQGPDGHFRTPDIPIAHGAEVIIGRSLVNDRAICPSGAFPDKEIQERVPESESIRTLRISLSLLGDGLWRRWRIKRWSIWRSSSAPPRTRKSAARFSTFRSWRRLGRWASAALGGRSARQPAVVLRRRLSERDGHY